MATTTPYDPERARHIERKATIMRIWQRMAGKYGALWISSMGGDAFDEMGELTPTAAEWLNGLRGLTRAVIYATIDRLDVMGLKHPPTLPEFRALCWNFPSIEDVEDYMAARAEPTPFARAVVGKLDLYKYRQLENKDGNAAKRRLREAYDRVCAEIQAGRVLPELPKTVSQEKKTRERAPDHIVHRELAKMAAILGEPEPTTEPRS